ARLLGAILKDEPPPLPDPHLNRVVATCLAKEPDDRWQTARDLMRELQWVADGTIAARAPTPAADVTPRARGRRVVVVAAWSIAAAVVGAAAMWMLVRRPDAPKPIVRFQLTALATAPAFVGNPVPSLALSPDGRRLVYSAGSGTPDLYLREL